MNVTLIMLVILLSLIIYLLTKSRVSCLDTIKDRLRRIFDPKTNYSNLEILSPLKTKDMIKIVNIINEGTKSQTVIVNGVVTSVTLCMVDKDGKYLDLNSLMFLVLHEMAHAAQIGKDHDKTYWDTFSALRNHAGKIGLYDNSKLPDGNVYTCPEYKRAPKSLGRRAKPGVPGPSEARAVTLGEAVIDDEGGIPRDPYFSTD